MSKIGLQALPEPISRREHGAGLNKNEIDAHKEPFDSLEGHASLLARGDR